MECNIILFIIDVILLEILLIFERILNFLGKLSEMEPMEEDNCISERTIYNFRPYVVTKLECKTTKWPTARSGHRAVCTESNLYCLGGFNPDLNVSRLRRRYRRTTSLFQELWEFNFATKKWRLCLNCLAQDMPEELASIAVIAKNDLLIAYGGTGYPFGEACSNQCYVFCTKGPSVTRLKVLGDLPTPQYGPAVVLHNNYLYAIGGTTGFEYSCDVHRLNLITKEWETVYLCRPERDDPSGRYRHEIAYNGNYIYILGGGTAQHAFDLVNLPVFDVEHNKWLYIKTNSDASLGESVGYPGARRCHSCVQYTTDGGIEAVIAGGYGENDVCFDDVWKLNLQTLQWNLLSTAVLPKPMYFHSAATSGNGCMYIFGGIEMDQIIRRTNKLYKVWTTIPNLSEICWDAVCHYNPNIDKYPKSTLTRLGIPRRFLNRLTETSEVLEETK